MATIYQKLEIFFAEYETRFNNALANIAESDIHLTADEFTDCFLEASPQGVLCAKNDKEFRTHLAKSFDFYRSIGAKAMKAISLRITLLDDYHVMVKVHWEALYVKRDSRQETITFDVIYFLQLLGETPKIFAYISGDEERMLKEQGLVAS